MAITNYWVKVKCPYTEMLLKLKKKKEEEDDNSPLQEGYLICTFAKETRSGLMLYLSQPNIVPSLPNAHIT